MVFPDSDTAKQFADLLANDLAAQGGEAPVKRGGAGMGAQQATPDALGGMPLSFDPHFLIGSFPGGAVWLSSPAEIVTTNVAGEPLGAALLLGEPPTLKAMVDATFADGQPRQETIDLSSLPANLPANLSGNLPGGGAAAGYQVMTLPANEGGRRNVFLLAREVSLERSLMKALLASRQLFRDLVACSTDFAFETDRDGRLSYVSSRGALGYAPEELIGQPARRLAALRAGDSAAWPFETHVPIEQGEIWLRRKDGSLGCFALAAVPVTNEDGYWCGARGVARDITEARERDAALRAALAQVRQLSETDGLTGLLNRRAFLEALAQQRAQGRGGALLYADLDHFKAVNDQHGHARGDQLLKDFAQALKASCRTSDLAARLGGDEFAVWLSEADAKAAGMIAERLMQAATEISGRYPVMGPAFGVSLGLRLAMAQEDAEQILGAADEAMYAEKRARKAKDGSQTR